MKCTKVTSEVYWVTSEVYKLTSEVYLRKVSNSQTATPPTDSENGPRTKNSQYKLISLIYTIRAGKIFHIFPRWESVHFCSLTFTKIHIRHWLFASLTTQWLRWGGQRQLNSTRQLTESKSSATLYEMTRSSVKRPGVWKWGDLSVAKFRGKLADAWV